jgi:isoliquiritigenin 2'-O-methyltransferase
LREIKHTLYQSISQKTNKETIMSSYTNGNGNGKVNNNVVETQTPQTGGSSDTLSAMVLGSVMVLPAVLNAAIELKLFDIIASSNDGFMSVFEIASKLPNQHSDLPNRLDRVLCVLASYSLLSVSNRTNDDGTTLRVYGVTSSGKYFVDDENDGGYLGSFTPFTCHKALFGMW